MPVRHEIAHLAVPLESIHPHPRNPRVADIDRLAGSLTEHGQYRPIVVRRATGEILAGNHTWRAAQQLGWTDIAVTFVDCDDHQALRILLADNRYADLAGYIDESLVALLQELAVTEAGLIGTGYTTRDLGDLVDGIDRDPNAVALTDVDDIPTDAPARTKPGDVWLLGLHRLICGDSTKLATYTKLLDATPADLLLSDPPYNVAYEGKTADRLTIENDNMSDAAFRAFLDDSFAPMYASMRPGAPAYIFHADTLGSPFRAAFTGAGFELKQVLVWIKNSLVLGRQDYHWQHEPILYGWKPGAAHAWYGGRTRTTLLDDQRTRPVDMTKAELVDLLAEALRESTAIREDRPARNADHPTMKPVRLLERLISNSTRSEDVVLDPFAGSGSTLIAAHHTARIARVVELRPGYCDVICRRWQEHTGERPILERTGKAHDMTSEKKPRGKARPG